MKNLKIIVLFPFMLLHYIIYLSVNNKNVIMVDIERWWKIHNMKTTSSSIIKLAYFLILYKEFRTLFYYRIGWIGKVLNLFLPGQSALFLYTKKIGYGLFLQHGFSTIVYANSIGNNCWINQNVTIGHSGKGIPTIGNNVQIGTGAIIIGPITIGNNVKIGAGAIVVDNIPDNSIVMCEKATVRKRN